MTDTTGTDNPLISSIFWGDAANGLTLAQLQARRAVAAAMASRSRPYPTTVGQGLTALGEGLGQGLYERNLAIAEAAQRQRDIKALRESQTVKPPAEASPPVAGGTGAVSDAGSPGTNVAAADIPAPGVEDSGPPPPVGTDALAASVLARQGIMPGSAPDQRVQMAARDTGTVSDVGSPGLTYGGNAAGPGASMMEPPSTSPPAPTAPSVAADAAAQQPSGPGDTPAAGMGGGSTAAGPPPPVGTDAMAGTMLAQAGVRPPGPPATPPPPRPYAPPPPAPGDVGRPYAPAPRTPATTSGAPQPAPGQIYAPPTTGLPVPNQAMPGTAYPAPGETRLTPPVPPGDIPPPPVRTDTPQMIQNRMVRNDPRQLGMRSPEVLQQMDNEYTQMKEARDKAFERQTEQWQKIRDTIIDQQKQYKIDIQGFPQKQQEAEKRQADLVRAQRFGSTEAANEIDKATMASAQKANSLVPSLRMIPELNGMVDKMFSGTGAEDKLAIWKFMNSVDRTVLGPIFGNKGYYTDAVEATEAFKSGISSMVASTLKNTVGSQGISNADREFAQKAAAGDISMEPESIKRVLDIARRMGVNTIREHNDQMNKVYDDPLRWDAAMHRMFKVDMPYEAYNPMDVTNLRAVGNSPEERARFDRIYGEGSARRVTGYGR